MVSVNMEQRIHAGNEIRIAGALRVFTQQVVGDDLIGDRNILPVQALGCT